MLKAEWTENISKNITRLDWGRGTKNLLAIGTENQIYFIDLEGKKKAEIIEVPKNKAYIRDFGQANVGLYILQWSPNGTYLLFNSGDWIGCYDTYERKTDILKIGEKPASIHVEAQDAASMKCVAWAPDSQSFALVSDFKESCKIFDVSLHLKQTTRSRKTYLSNKVSLSPIAWSPNSNLIAYGLNHYQTRNTDGSLPPHWGDHHVFFYDVVKANETPLNYYGWIWMMEWDSIQKDILYFATNKGVLDVFNVQKNQIQESFKVTNSAIISFYPCGKRQKILFLNIKGEVGEFDLKTHTTKILMKRDDITDQDIWAIAMSVDPKEEFFVTGFSQKINVYHID